MAPAPSWTGFYIFGGAGGGIWDADNSVSVDRDAGTRLTDQPAAGWRRLVRHGRRRLRLAVQPQLGCRHLRRRPVRQPQGTISDPVRSSDRHREARRTTWAAGARLGYLVAPNVLSYVNGGYTGSHWSGSTLTQPVSGAPSGLHTDSFTPQRLVRRRRRREQPEHLRHHRAGWFMKTEYRAAYYDNTNARRILSIATGAADRPTTSPSSRSCRPSAPRWSTASTGVARSSPSTESDCY